ncbi:MAG: phosphatase PAP2 family protein [Gemmatimonadota bacterium]|nr:phosphatase PAP2 family protein [Gemmatimonadota bacterium]
MTDRRSLPIDTGVLAIDRLTMGYLGATGLFALLVGGMTGAVMAAVHVAIGFIIWSCRKWQPRAGFLGFLRVGYPSLMMPAFYAELATLNQFVSSGYFDQTVIAWDEAIFGGQPSMFLSEILPWVPFSEAIHFGYFTYYLIMPGAIFGAYFASGREGIHRTVFTLMATFFTCYATFILFPVAGPRYEFERIGGAIADGTVYQLVHRILESGSSRGTAFPSSHVAASVAIILAVWREDSRWFWILLMPTILLSFGTVYGRFHYAIDAVAGLVYGIAVWAVTPRAFRALRGRQPDPSPEYQTGV